jgi:hypothetical protein
MNDPPMASGYIGAIPANPREEERKGFFFEKKKQKTFALHTGFCNCVGSAPASANAHKSFLLLFFKKEALPSLLLP